MRRIKKRGGGEKTCKPHCPPPSLCIRPNGTIHTKEATQVKTKPNKPQTGQHLQDNNTQSRSWRKAATPSSVEHAGPRPCLPSKDNRPGPLLHGPRILASRLWRRQVRLSMQSFPVQSLDMAVGALLGIFDITTHQSLLHVTSFVCPPPPFLPLPSTT